MSCHAASYHIGERYSVSLLCYLWGGAGLVAEAAARRAAAAPDGPRPAHQGTCGPPEQTSVDVLLLLPFLLTLLLVLLLPLLLLLLLVLQLVLLR